MKYLTWIVRFSGVCSLYLLGRLWFQNVYPSKILTSALLLFVAWWMLAVKINNPTEK